jgi:hypothetical protein
LGTKFVLEDLVWITAAMDSRNYWVLSYTEEWGMCSVAPCEWSGGLWHDDLLDVYISWYGWKLEVVAIVVSVLFFAHLF